MLFYLLISATRWLIGRVPERSHTSVLGTQVRADQHSFSAHRSWWAAVRYSVGERAREILLRPFDEREHASSFRFVSDGAAMRSPRVQHRVRFSGATQPRWTVIVNVEAPSPHRRSKLEGFFSSRKNLIARLMISK